MLNDVEHEVMEGLKDFQRATVERIDYLFRNGEDRLLVADEVGMGKTMIAKGVIAKFAKLRYEEGDDLVKVVYICSNQSIANQNIEELDIFKTGYDDVANTRLSMQHLMIKKSEDDNKGKFLQLIPLTPQTSFKQTSGIGNVNERFIMFRVLRQMPVFLGLEKELETLLCAGADASWKYWTERDESSERYANFNYKKLVKKYENYEHRDPENDSDIFHQMEPYNDLLEEIASYLKNEKKEKRRSWDYIIGLRKMFAAISVDMLNPDLVIMDEFQRFQFLISDKSSETKALTDKFLNPANEKMANKVRILLLSATPYKLYSTLEELGDANNDEAYREFNQVMKFLHNDETKYQSFRDVWGDYETSLRKIGTIELKELKEHKNRAEEAMYDYVSRTERISVMESGDFIDDHTKDVPLKLEYADILAHVDVARLLDNTDLCINFPIDYIKSCPFALSYMNKYETKRKIRRYFDEHKGDVRFAKSKLLWLNKNAIKEYKDVKGTNARLERLKEEVFEKQDTSLLLWLPPCKPYYRMEGVFKDKENYSKILLFSSWEMVPRMIGTLISYEEERRTIAKLIKENNQERNGRKQKLLTANYFAKNRYPSERLVSKNYAALGLLYPSKTLSSLYNPIDCYRRGLTDISSIESEVAGKIECLINNHKEFKEDGQRDEDLRWYYYIPMMLDGQEYASQLNLPLADSFFAEINEKGFVLHRKPDDLIEVLTNMVIASPANCLMRIFHRANVSLEVADKFVKYFNSPEATAIVELAIKKQDDEGNHWKNTLAYSKQGNIQAMLDEYVHLLTKGKGVPQGDTEEESKRRNRIVKRMTTSLGLSAATYKLESFKDFELKVNARKNAKDQEEIEKTGSGMRSYFAAAFSKSDNAETERMDRKDALRTAFNSPFWPFVLASTSIGQEGLDFHFYCRKMMHWNLPSNPIDLEQREGRINRYKCLAIRQNVVAEYGDTEIDEHSTDIWNDLFRAAQQERKDGQSELIPYWCFGPNQKIKIERILAHYPMSLDEAKYDRLIKVLSLYRLTMGQARQEDLLEHIFHHFENPEILKKYFIDLSPFSHNKHKE